MLSRSGPKALTLVLSLFLAFAAVILPAAAASAAVPPAVSSLHDSSCPNLIEKGQLSGCVTRLQQLLNGKGAALTVDGNFGENTFSAVKSYQSGHGLSADGIVGPNTKDALEGGPTPPSGTLLAKVVDYANQAVQGKVLSGWSGGAIPYSWGGGHGGKPGPSLGTCSGYTGSIKPCPADSTKGLDCSGFSRWIYALAGGSDLLGAGNTDNQLAKMHKTSSPKPGDLAFFGTAGNTHHVGIYLGNDKMANAPYTGVNVRIDPVSSHSDLVGYYTLGS